MTKHRIEPPYEASARWNSEWRVSAQADKGHGIICVQFARRYGFDGYGSDKGSWKFQECDSNRELEPA
jgi:hypothetical protein